MASTKGFTVLYQNVRDLRNKTKEFKENMELNNPDIVFVTEVVFLITRW